MVTGPGGGHRVGGQRDGGHRGGGHRGGGHRVALGRRGGVVRVRGGAAQFPASRTEVAVWLT